MGVNPLNTNNAQKIRNEIDHIADVNIQRAESQYFKGTNKKDINLDSLSSNTETNSKVKFLGREFDKPSMSDMLGDVDLTPKIVENSANKRFDVSSHIHPEHLTNIFRHKSVEIPDLSEKSGPKWNQLFKNKGKKNPEGSDSLDEKHANKGSDTQEPKNPFSKFWESAKNQMENRKIEDMSVVEQKLFMGTQMGSWMVQEMFSNLRNPIERNTDLQEKYKQIIEK